jgi:nucleoside-diphosphate-sugar epimerase
MKYLIFGKDGQLAKEFQKKLTKENRDFLALSHQECNISDLNKVLKIFKSYKPDIVLNCAAYNLVDKAEEEYWNAYKTNALGVRNLAYLSKLYNSYLITYSTDYVFDGDKENGFFVSEGFVEVTGSHVNILSEEATPIGEIEVSEVQKKYEEIVKKLAMAKTKEELEAIEKEREKYETLLSLVVRK